MNLAGDERTVRVAALRERRGEERRGNDAPWKAWKTQKPKASFPLFPPGLEIRPKTKAPDFHISTAPAAALSHWERTKNEPENKFRLTKPVTSSTLTVPASLRSDRARLGVGMNDRNQIGITAHLHRNQHRAASVP
jgi:hypothetical protein